MRLSLKYRIAITIFVLEVVMVSFVLWQALGHSLSQTLARQSDYEIALLNAISGTARIALLTEEYGDLQQYIEAARGDERIPAIVVADADGRLVASTRVNEVGRRLQLQLLADDGAEHWRSIQVLGPSGSSIGTLAMQFSIKPMLTAYAQARTRGLLIAAVSMAVIAFVGVLMGTLLTRRLGRLTQAAERLERGEPHQALALAGKDELAQLGRAFDAMAIALADRQRESEQALRALQSSEQRLSLALDATQEGVWDWDISKGTVFFSSGWARLLGCDPAAVAPRIGTWLERIHDDDRAEVEQRLHAHLDGAMTGFLAEHRVRAEDGGWRWVAARGRVVERDANGRPARLVGTLEDIEESRQAREVLRAANERLEQGVRQRTRELEAAKSEAERANRAKSAFLSSMSHELRTPMNAVLGFGQLLEIDDDPPLAEKQRRFVHEILHAGEHLLTLINEVLELSQIEAGRLQMSIGAIILGPVFAECLALVDRSASSRGIAVNGPSDDCRRFAVRADRVRLKQIIVNLLTNAIKYNRPQGRVCIDCELRGEMVRIRVRDTGPGIAPERLNELFIPFNRLGAETSGVEGVGIGLALCRQIVGLMGGRIGVDSVAGKGSVFWIELPHAAEADVGVPAPGDADRFAAAMQSRADSGLMLYVEDDPASLHLMEQIIEQRTDVRLLTAHEPWIGLELATIHKPDVIFIDINMPGVDGYELLRRLRAAPATAATPVVAISANAMPSDVRRGREAGFTDYLTKPLKIDQFLQVLNALLR